MKCPLGALVRITEPQLFVRCGYPLGVDDGRKEVNEKHGTAVLQLLTSVRAPTLGLDLTETTQYKKIVDVLAHRWLEGVRFGGRTRSVHTRLDEAWRGKEMYVLRRRVVRSGEYASGGGQGEDYDPPYLENSKAHVLLLLGKFSDIKVGRDHRPDGNWEIEIEERFCEPCTT